MVHQIWLGDRREDPTAANYSAEDLVLIQRDIGRLAQYTAEMGATADLDADLVNRMVWSSLSPRRPTVVSLVRLRCSDAGAFA